MPARQPTKSGQSGCRASACRQSIRAWASTASDGAWKTPTGDVAWTSDKLQYRGLSAPLGTNRSVVFGDAEGLLHFLARDTGQALLRLPTDGSAIVAAPVAAGGTLLVVTRKGGVYAFRSE